MTHQQSGTEITIASTMSRIKSFDKSITMLVCEDPSTFLIPISFIRCCAIKVDNPKSPKQAIKIERQENKLNKLPNF